MGVFDVDDCVPIQNNVLYSCVCYKVHRVCCKVHHSKHITTKYQSVELEVYNLQNAMRPRYGKLARFPKHKKSSKIEWPDIPRYEVWATVTDIRVYDICVSDMSVNDTRVSEGGAARVTAEPPMNRKSQSQGHTKQSQEQKQSPLWTANHKVRTQKGELATAGGNHGKSNGRASYGLQITISGTDKGEPAAEDCGKSNSKASYGLQVSVRDMQ